VTEDDRRIGKGARQIGRVSELSGIDLQIETEIVSPEQRETAPPVRARKQVPRGRKSELRISMPIEDVAEPTQVFRLGVRLDHPRRARFVQRDLGHDRVRKSGSVRDRLQP